MLLSKPETCSDPEMSGSVHYAVFALILVFPIQSKQTHSAQPGCTERQCSTCYIKCDSEFLSRILHSNLGENVCLNRLSSVQDHSGLSQRRLMVTDLQSAGACLFYSCVLSRPFPPDVKLQLFRSWQLCDVFGANGRRELTSAHWTEWLSGFCHE